MTTTRQSVGCLSILDTFQYFRKLQLSPNGLRKKSHKKEEGVRGGAVAEGEEGGIILFSYFCVLSVYTM